jgi:hypothetical protein
MENRTNTADDPIADTEPRVAKVIPMYIASAGSPQIVVLNVQLWDLHAFYGHHPDANSRASLPQSQWSSVMDEYKTNLLKVLKALRASLPKGTLLALHTVPTITWGQPMQAHYNNALRSLAKEHGLVLLDWAVQLTGYDTLLLDDWGAHICYLRDGHHPRQMYMISMLQTAQRVGALWSLLSSSTGK